MANNIDHHGYRKIRVGDRQYKAHRLAWVWMTGDWPKEIDHINGVKNDNRFANLREATRSQNRANSRVHANNKAGLKSVCWHQHNRKYRAVIHINGKQITLGYWDTPERAFFAYALAARKYHGAFTRLKGGKTFLVDKIITRLERIGAD